MTRYDISNRLVYLSGGIQAHMGMWPSAASNWWEVAGETCVAAYQAKGAASLAASYVNLANPGTYDAAPGGAPTWDAGTGWTFNGSTQYLVSAASASLKPLTYIARISTLNTTGFRTILGGNDTAGASLDVSDTTNIPRFLKQDTALIGSGTTGFSASADTVIAVTYDSSGNYAHYLDGAGNGSGTNNQTFTARTLWIGAQGPTVAPQQQYSGNILAVAIYSTTLDATQAGTLSAAMAAL